MAMPTLSQLRTFLEVIESGSITLAARALEVTQPAASQQMRALERAVGVRLIERAEGRMLPTAAGAAIEGPARRAVAAAAEAVVSVSAYRSGEAGRIRLGTGATACIYLLPPLIAAVRKRMPGLELVVSTGNTPELLARVEKADLDAAIVTISGRAARSLAVRVLFAAPLVALLPEGMAPEKTDLGAADLARLPLILYERGSHTRALIDAWFRRADHLPRPTMELGSVEAIKVLVAGGLGASILPQAALASPPPGARIVSLRPPLKRRIGIVMRHEKVMERGLRRFVEALG
ncbi:MAG: LysR family transcriptional regulator [Acetobacteraceae bacterium]